MEWEEKEEEAEKERGEIETQEYPAVLTWSLDKLINEKNGGPIRIKVDDELLPFDQSLSNLLPPLLIKTP